MNQLNLFLLSATLLLSACANPPISRQYLNLAGKWETEIGCVVLPGTTAESHRGDSTIDSTLTSRLSQRYSCVRPLVYSSEIDIPKSFEDKHLSIIMEKTKSSTLWIDGDSIGSYNYLHTPHIYDITGIKAGHHKIQIRIDNSEKSINPALFGSHALSEHTQTNWNGILGKFCIEAKPQIYIDDIQIYPDLNTQKINIQIVINSVEPCSTELIFNNFQLKQNKSKNCEKYKFDITLVGAIDTLNFEIPFPKDVELWSEWSPNRYQLQASLSSKFGTDCYSVNYGIREFKTKNSQFTINGKPTFLRGKHDGCVFPLTAYAPMSVDEWQRIFKIAKDYGINHYRFHSWTPPHAAFEAADIEGIYLQAELPYWGEINREKDSLMSFLKHEGELIIKEFGNHPSFVMMAHGNELSGDVSLMQEWTDEFRRLDNRRLYAFGSNNNLGFRGPQEGEDFYVACRVGGEQPNSFNTHVRASFSFADAYDGGIINGTYPNLSFDYSEAIANCKVPVVSHESCQFEIYPDYDEIVKYTGVLIPINYNVFRDRLKPNQLEQYAKDFHYASGALSMICYKADIEMCLRTANFGGFQMLDLQDYPGQGSALVGVLDAFMESKGLISPKQFRGFCSEIVPLAKMERYTFLDNEQLIADFLVANYSSSNVTSPLKWELYLDSLKLTDGEFKCAVNQGGVSNVGRVNINIADLNIKNAAQLKLLLSVCNNQNTYDLWVYPSKNQSVKCDYVTKLDNSVLQRLKNGESILFVPNHKSIEKQSVGGMFTTDYWNYAMFKSISESLNRPVSPGTMGYLIDDKNPLFIEFPTEQHSNWQWWTIAKHTRPFILDGTAADFRPIVMAIDNIERNHKLGALFEFAIENGRILVCMTDLNAISDKCEGRQYIKAINDYMASENFNPQCRIDWKSLNNLFKSEISERNIVGVKNITDYTGE